MNQKETVQAVIDVGSSWLRVLIARCETAGNIEILGCGIHGAPSVKNGVVKDITATADALRWTIEEAERQSGFAIRNVDAAIGGAQISGINSDAQTMVGSGTISREDVYETVYRARHKVADEQHELLHILEQEYVVDEHSGVEDPLGMMGDVLQAHYHILRAKKNLSRNFRRCIEVAGVGVNALISSALASSYAAATEQERDLGVCVLDIGAGTVDFVVWKRGKPLFSGGLDMGGENISSKLAEAFRTPRQYAEMLKCQQGAILRRLVKSAQLELQSTGLLPSHKISSDEMVEIISHGYLAIFSQLEQTLVRQGMREMTDGGLILTGGAAQIPGLAEYTAENLNIPVRIAKPPMVAGLPDHLQHDAGMMTSLGLLKLLYEPLVEHVWAQPVKHGIIRQIKHFFNKR